MDSKELCIKLVKSETEKEVIAVLTEAGYWQDKSAWQFYGGLENNFKDIGNQQSSPDTALVEKIMNSEDAVLIKECIRRGIKPDGNDAPQTQKEALEKFFDIKYGSLTNLNSFDRSKLSDMIMIVATGSKNNPSYSIIDKGEGQTPKMMPDTFLSLTRGNKIRIPFVQGRYNMGGTGALLFCGYHNLQLIISKRYPEIADKSDETSAYWGFTIVRREDPVNKDIRNSTFKYLAPNAKILMFKSNELNILPGGYPNPYEKPLEFGSYIKLYEYQLKGGLKSLITFDLNYRLSLLIPNIALPVKLYERRNGYRANSYETTLAGISVRLEDDRGENIENGFPNSSDMTIKGNKIKLQIYAFKPNRQIHYKKGEGVIFTYNGQAHGFLPATFYERRNVGMSYLKDSILVIADCSELPGRVREDLFMNSRDRLREGDFKDEIEETLEEIISTHPGLRKLREKRRAEELQSKITEGKPAKEILEKLISKSKTLAKLFTVGTTISNPFDLTNSNTTEKFEGKEFPTYFRLNKKYDLNKPKHCPINRRFRIQFETDAENNYFNRDRNPGSYKLQLEDGTTASCIFNLWNGIANLNVSLPENVKVNDRMKFLIEITDETQLKPFKEEFYVLVDKAEVNNIGTPGDRVPPAGDENIGDRKKPKSLAMPNILEVHENEWPAHNFNKFSALDVKDAGENQGYDFYVNMDNVWLQEDIKSRSNIEPKILMELFKFGIFLIGIALLRSHMAEEDKQDNQSAGESILDAIAKTTSAIAPVILSMILNLSTLVTE
ncbi:MAG: hypothetical protein ACP5U0_09025 [Caldisphaera sp.]